MSVLHRQEISGGRVLEVRSAQATRRLYVDGVLHTSYSPARALTGAVWDPLALAGFLVPTDAHGRRVEEALVLGVGGGAAIHLLRRHLAPRRIVGIEADAEIAQVARDWFWLDDLASGAASAVGARGPDAETQFELVLDDAVAWCRRQRRPRFDLIVDDIFGESGGEPLRDPQLDDPGAGSAWWKRLAGLLTPRGVLVVNFTWAPDLYASALCQDVEFRRTFPVALQFSFEQYENAIVALCQEPVSPARFGRDLESAPSLRGALRLLRFDTHRLWPTG